MKPTVQFRWLPLLVAAVVLLMDPIPVCADGIAIPGAREDWRCKTVQGMGPALAKSFEARSRLLWGAATLLAPHPGFFYADDLAGLSLNWSWYYPLGAAAGQTTIERGCGASTVDEFKPHRLGLDTTLVIGKSTQFLLRPAYRFVWHPTDSWFGMGIGLGTSVQFAGAGDIRSSISPELVFHLGRCCRPFYLVVSVRYDRFFAGPRRNTVMTNIGVAYW
mgnify:FL=1